MNLLTIQGLAKKFGTRSVLQDISFDVRHGEVLGLIGPNGAGKTTLFEYLAGLLSCDNGGVFYNANPLTPQQRQNILFYMPDGILPWAQQQVCWSLKFFERLYQLPKKSEELLIALNLKHLQTATINSLSKGERKRLLLALALLTPQPLLLLDEPFDGLDLRQTREVMQLLRAQSEQGRTLLLSIHQLNDAARVCDRLILLSNGEIVGVGTVEELRAQAKLTAGGLEEIFLALT